MATAVPPLAFSDPGARAPLARREPHVVSLHGDVRVDDYFWLRRKEDPQVLAYLKAENAYTEARTQHTAELREQLYAEILGRIKQSDLTVPWFDRGWWYYSRTEAGKPYPLHCRKHGTLGADEKVYVDQNALAEGHAYHALGGMEVSPDGRLLIYLEDVTAFREYTLVVKDLATGALLDRIPHVWNGTAWAEDSRTFFYVTADAAKRGCTVWRHEVGRPWQEDPRVFEEPNILYTVSLSRSKSGEYVFIASEGFTSTEVRTIPTGDPGAVPQVLVPRREPVEYTADHVPGAFLIVTNDGAENFRILALPEHDRTASAAVEWLPHRDEVFVEGVEVFREHVVVSERVEGLRRLRVQRLDGSDAHEITFPDAAYAVSLGANADFESNTLRYLYSSPVAPPAVYDYDMRGRTRVLRKQQEIPSGLDPDRYDVERFMVPGRDGVRIPVSLLRPRVFVRDGRHPLMLYGYGAYGTTVEAAFTGPVLSLVDRGFAVAVAHVRGGLELGRRWYDAGKMLNKLNTFDDFIEVAEDLVRRGYTSPERMVAAGASAGGLLVGAVANMRPDLFRAILADVPFVDVINTLLDPDLPLTAQEWEQWGNPRIEAEYRYLLRYSPYDNVTAQDYPWMLVTTSLNDSQVMYWEPAKWVARIRAVGTGSNPLFLRTNLAGGHSGSSDRYARLREVAFRYAFLLDAVGLTGNARPVRA
jgi:oligopeptidase B